jgi:hypothetical protein
MMHPSFIGHPLVVVLRLSQLPREGVACIPRKQGAGGSLFTIAEIRRDC